MRKITSLLMLLCMFVGTAWAQIAQLSDLSNDKAYVLKSGRSDGTTNHYLLYHTAAPNNLSSTYGSGHALDYANDVTNFHFAIYKQDDKYYFYNLAAQKFIGNNDNNNGAIPLVEMPTNAVEIRTSQNATYNFVLSTNGSGALNAAATTGCHGVVNWSGGYNNLQDAGNIYQIIEVADLSTEVKTRIADAINVGSVIAPAQAAVDGASNTLVGAYTTAAVTALAEKLVTYNTNKTIENFNAVKTAYDNLLANGQKVTLSAGEVFTVKCVENTRGYMVYSTVEGKGSETQVYLAGTNNTSHHAAIDAEGIYKEWSLVEVDGKKYIFNTQKQQFITSDGVVKFSDTGYALNFVDIGDCLWEIQFESNNKYLSYSPGWGADCVRTEGGIDNGCKFYIEKAETALAEGVLTSMENKINVGKLATWKESNLAVLGYVGGYPATMQSAIEEVATYSDALAFDETNASEKLDMASGYYYIKATGEGNTADWYATYGSNTTGFIAAPLGDGEKLGTKHIWSFEDDEDGYMLQAVNTGKYVTLAAAPAVSQIASTSVNAPKLTLTDNGLAKFTIKEGDNVMRTEGNGDINYWWGEENETWYIIPATTIDITIGKAGYSTTYLPFDVTLPNTVEAYAVTATSQDYATLTKKDNIPANTGAILKGEGTHTLTIAKANSDWDGNLLEGTNVPTNVEAAAYILSKQGDNIGFYPVKFEVSTNTENDGEGVTYEAFKNNANKAYLPASAVPAGARFISFDFGGETAIESVEAENVNVKAVVYDLAGRRVQGAQKGIFIVNGKKVIK